MKIGAYLVLAGIALTVASVYAYGQQPRRRRWYYPRRRGLHW